MESILITNQAVRAIRDESLNCDVETGGRLLGYPRGRLIDFATLPGTNATKHACLFSDDVEYQKQIISDLAKESGGKRKQLGSWHLHPGMLTRPSSRDQVQARAIAEDFEGDPNACPLIAVIANVTKKEKRSCVHLYAYTFRKNRNRLEIANLDMVSDNDPAVRKVREDEPPALIIRNADLFNDDDFVFHETSMGNKRLTYEIRELQTAGFKVQVNRRKRDNRLILVVLDRDGMQLLLQPPREYPLNPPRVYELPSGQEWDSSGCPAILQWNSDRVMLEVVTHWLAERNAGLEV